MRIIRIEHTDGWGMFRSRSSRTVVHEHPNPIFKALWDKHNAWNPGGMPIPQKDGINMEKNSRQWFCGFKPEQFPEWITPIEIQCLTEHGFSVYEIEATEYQTGKFQIVFAKESIIQKTDVTSDYLPKYSLRNIREALNTLASEALSIDGELSSGNPVAAFRWIENYLKDLIK